jgi:hypothetical protein
MTDDTKRRMAKVIVDAARYSERMRDDPRFAAMRKFQEEMRSAIAEAEIETPVAPEVAQNTDDVFREEIRTINKETKARGDLYWPNGKEASQLARQRLRARGINVDRDHGDDIAGEPEFKAQRRPPGQHS